MCHPKRKVRVSAIKTKGPQIITSGRIFQVGRRAARPFAAGQLTISLAPYTKSCNQLVALGHPTIMISDAKIQELCAKAVDESDPEELEEVAAALKMVSTQYLRERRMFLVYTGIPTVKNRRSAA
jgi:hypothetical protein